MKETTLLRLSLACAVLGIALLYVLSEHFLIAEAHDAGQLVPGRTVTLAATIAGVQSTDKVCKYVLEDAKHNALNAVLFKASPDEECPTSSEPVTFTGTVELYQGTVELLIASMAGH